ncbi:MAG TPA: MBOAT family O-acyltransferase [bacterium]|jgi:alginate O-acetyltransferase complex protein AlgI|nr:MBOAT family O-acyltransferase [bacterium]
MLFNSFRFLFLFLPVTVTVHALLAAGGRGRASKAWLLAASLYFYGSAKPAFLAVLLASIAFNYWMGGAILGRPLADMAGRLRRYRWGLAGNLGLLGAYKYLGALAAFLGPGLALPRLAVPLGISFFTFQQITFLNDCLRRDRRDGGLLECALFTAFFPSLIAGPISRFRAMIPQWTDPARLRFDLARLAEGLMLFLIGLAKKTVVADRLAIWADAGFSQTATLSWVQAWAAALAYAMQLYFDFSGYSDMALGCARMLNIDLPWNFDSPYQAVDIRDFWRRWHISLSEWFRTYVFEPIQFRLRSLGLAASLLALMASFTLMGLWHGPTAAFLAYGALHGAYMGGAILVAGPIKRWKQRLGRGGDFLARPWHVAVTFLMVLVSFVVFRAANPASALQVLAGMAGLHGQPGGWAWQLEALNHAHMPGLLMAAYLGGVLCLALAAAFFAPNTKQSGRLFERPALAGLCMALLLLLSVAHMTKTAEFLYFNY